MLRRRSRLFSSHMSLQQIEGRNRITNSGNVLSHRKQSLHGFSLRLPGLFEVIPFVGEGTANIWLSMKRTWGCRDAPSRPTSSLLICVSLVTQEVLKSLLSSPIWPLRDFVWVVDYSTGEGDVFTYLPGRTRKFVCCIGKAVAICPACL